MIKNRGSQGGGSKHETAVAPQGFAEGAGHDHVAEINAAPLDRSAPVRAERTADLEAARAQAERLTRVKSEFLEHANEEQAHADEIAERIVQLGGEPDLDPQGLASKAHSEYVEGDTLRDMIREDLVAERIAIESYREIIHWLGNGDSTTRKMMEEILAKEEEHADDMASLLAGLKE